MNKRLINNSFKTKLLWSLPITYEVWYMILDILPRKTRVFEKGNEIITCNEIIEIFIDIMIFLRACHILYFFLYIILISVFKNTYKSITIIFVLFQILSIIFINYIYAQPQSIFDLAYSICYFIPFYILVYILTRRI